MEREIIQGLNEDATQDCIDSTNLHIDNVNKKILWMIEELKKRGLTHDASKLKSPELEVFVKVTPKLQKLTYGSQEYKDSLKEMGPALDHHYQNNPHHPEFHKDGIKGMTLIDLLEMFADQYAATQRHADGDFLKSLEINKTRFDMSDDLICLFKNTYEQMEDLHS